MGLVDNIRNEAKKSGQNKGKFVYFREGQKQRFRFLNDMEDGMEITFHDSFEQGVNVPCQEIFGRDCDYCEEEGLRTRSQYAWAVWDYEAKEVKIFMFAVNNCSPIPALMAMYDTYGTLVDRDYVITSTGKGSNKTFSVVPMDKQKFRNTKAKPLSEKAILKYLDKAFPNERADGEDYDDDEEENTKRKKKSSKGKKPPMNEPEDDEMEQDADYEDLSAKELYNLCKERDIDCKPKKTERYYIKLLEEYDEAQDDWGDDEEDEDDWDDEE